MERNKTCRVSMEIYDADGELCECLGGNMRYDEIRERMIDVLKNDGIPVIRRLGKHEAKKSKSDYLFNDAMRKKLKTMTDNAEEVLKPRAIVRANDGGIVPLPALMVLEYEFDGVRFRSAGSATDVHRANELLMKHIFEE